MVNKPEQSPEQTPEQSAEDPDFETALQELEGLVERLESGEMDLDESLQHFKRGVEISRHCRAILDRARQQVEALGDPDDPDSAAPFDADSGERSAGD